MSPRRVVYTVLMGGYESLLEQPQAGAQGTDLICFTDDPETTSETWQVRHVKPALPADPNRSSRRPKILAHEYLADYDESLYIDNAVLLTAPADVVFDHMLTSTEPMAVARHSFRESLREEFEAVVEIGLDAGWVVAEQLGHYERAASHVLAGPTLWGGLLARRHNESAVREAMQIWWEHVLRYSRRDQLSLPLALEMAGLDPLIHRVNNRHSAFHEWPDERVFRSRNPSAPLPDALQRIAAQESELLEARQRIAVLEDELLAVRTSTSWRMTRPVRTIAELVRGVE
jgi:hypothetical protein